MSKKQISRVRLSDRQIADLVVCSLVVVERKSKEFDLCRLLRYLPENKLEFQTVEGGRVFEAKPSQVFFPTTTEKDFNWINIGESFRFCRGGKESELDALVRIETIPSRYGDKVVRGAVITCIMHKGKKVKEEVGWRVSVEAHEIHAL